MKTQMRLSLKLEQAALAPGRSSVAGNSFDFLTAEQIHRHLREIATRARELHAAAPPAEVETEGPPANSLMPQPGDYVYVPFRFLSATIVGAGSWKATDFRKAGVLKKAAPMLTGKQVYLDHSLWSVENVRGIVTETAYDEGYTDEDGTEVPPGINGIIRVDAKAFPALARQLMGTPPDIQSVSVTVEFEFSYSHEFKDRDGNFDEYRFWDAVGTEVEGRTVCYVAEAITDMCEVSLVSFGADPYAKAIDAEGKLINIDRTAVVSAAKNMLPAGAQLVEAAEADMREFAREHHKMFARETLGFSKNLLHLAKAAGHESANGRPEPHLENSAMSKELTAALAAVLGVAETELTVERLRAANLTAAPDLAELKLAAGKAESLTAEVARLTGELTTATTELTAAKAEAEAGKKAREFHAAHVEAQREALVATYAKVPGRSEKQVADFRDLVKLAPEEKVAAMLANEGVSTAQTYGVYCTKCGTAQHLSAQRSAAGGGEPENGVAETEREHLALNFE